MADKRETIAEKFNQILSKIDKDLGREGRETGDIEANFMIMFCNFCLMSGRLTQNDCSNLLLAASEYFKTNINHKFN